MSNNKKAHAAQDLRIEANCMDAGMGSPELAAAMLRSGAKAIEELAQLKARIETICTMYSPANQAMEIERLARKL